MRPITIDEVMLVSARHGKSLGFSPNPSTVEPGPER